MNPTSVHHINNLHIIKTRGTIRKTTHFPRPFPFLFLFEMSEKVAADQTQKGKLRPFQLSTPLEAVLESIKPRKIDRLFFFAIFTLSFLIRFYKLPEPPKVVFDETHFGGYAKDYYDGKFFIDVHPPLGKLLFYWVALLFKWDGKYDFSEIGANYDQNVPFVQMRSVSAIFGVIVSIATYAILRVSNCRPIVALFGSFLITIENSGVTQSRLILLDTPLIGFMALTVLSYKMFEVARPFSKQWFRFLLLTGIFLGLTVSVKLTGVFVIAWIGVMTVYQLWVISGDLNVRNKEIVGHIFARLGAFLVIPLTIYCGIFSIHFMALPKNGTGSGAVSPKFRAQFVDSSDITETAVDVSFGSLITLKHHRLEMYLHSHEFKYKTGTRSQQVTMYGFDDDANNDWIIESVGTNYDGKFDSKFRGIKDGAYVKLYHAITGKYLRASDVRPPNSEHDYSNEVSCDGNRTDTQDMNYEWRINILGRKPHAENNLPNIKVRATETVFQLVHKGTGCVLMSHDTKLPDWGFHQNQVLCVSEPTIPNTLWYIEKNSHPIIDNDWENYPRVKLPQMSFYEKMLEYHQAMWRVNKGFVEEHPYSSIPYAWPVVHRGINYYSNSHGGEKLTDEPGSHIYFLGNVAIYLGGLFLVVAFSVKFAIYIFWHMNPFVMVNEPFYRSSYYTSTAGYLAGWFLNYFPYIQMDRQLFAHHYLASVFFLVLAIGQFAEFQVCKNRNFGYIFMVLFGAFSGYVFWKFLPLIYGLKWDMEKCFDSQWFSSWDFDCFAYE